MEAEEGSVKTIRNVTENLRGEGKWETLRGSKDLLMLHGTRTGWVEWLSSTTSRKLCWVGREQTEEAEGEMYPGLGGKIWVWQGHRVSVTGGLDGKARALGENLFPSVWPWRHPAQPSLGENLFWEHSSLIASTRLRTFGHTCCLFPVRLLQWWPRMVGGLERAILPTGDSSNRQCAQELLTGLAEIVLCPMHSLRLFPPSLLSQILELPCKLKTLLLTLCFTISRMSDFVLASAFWGVLSGNT